MDHDELASMLEEIDSRLERILELLENAGDPTTWDE